MTQGIYKISFRDEVIYVGQSRNIEKRWSTHMCSIRKNDKRHGNTLVVNIGRKYGVDSLDFQVIEEVKDVFMLNEREVYWIRFFDYPKGNFVIPSEDGLTFSSSFISEHLKGENNPNYGNRWSEEQKQKARERTAGKYNGENNPNYGNRGDSSPLCKHPCPYTKDELIKALQESNGFWGLSRKLKVHQATVKRWCCDFSIPHKAESYGGRKASQCPYTKEELISLLEGKGCNKLAEELGHTLKVTQRWCRLYELPTRVKFWKGGGKNVREESQVY